jgi:phosphatidylinositol 4-kinase type 2
MPRHRPAASGYARLAQADEDERSQGILEDSEDEDAFQHPLTLSSSTSRYAPIQPSSYPSMRAAGNGSPDSHRKRPSRRTRSNSGVDIKAINARLERWAEEIASKFKINKVKGKSQHDEQFEIHHSVFQPPDWIRPMTSETLVSDTEPENDKRMTKWQYDDVVESVKIAIEMGVHPKMIAQGSSGSYFARNSDGKVVGVFKPKDEEPYASRNPKWTKWLHRNLFPFFFGRACLIPNLSYVSEAAAYVLDSRLRTNLVPYTDIVWLSSKSFYYDFWDRRSYWRGKKKLPAKQGSLQVFLKGYKDANIFLRQHPWPDQNNSGFRTEDAPRRKRRKWTGCRPFGTQSDDEDEDSHVMSPPVQEEPQNKQFHWTDNIKQSFREELEKLVILDYIMRNTDRGLDNWMIKVDWRTETVSLVSEPPKLNASAEGLAPPAQPASASAHHQPTSNETAPYRRQEAMAAVSRSGTPSNAGSANPPFISLGAIDNSLSWPWKHPDAVSSLSSHRFNHLLTLRRSGDLSPLAGCFCRCPLLVNPSRERLESTSCLS